MQAKLLECMTEELLDAGAVLSSIAVEILGDKERADVLAVRGLLAYQHLVHDLQMRHRVEFGIPG